jgi:hypothetical protein
MIPVFIICRDRVTCLKKLVSWLEKTKEADIYLIDNDSAYPPLGEYYEKVKHPVIRTNKNEGPDSPWHCGIVNQVNAEKYVVTDCDNVPSKECPLNLLSYLSESMDKYGNYPTIGLALRLDRIPNRNEIKDEIIWWESQFWDTKVDDFWEARNDSNFAMYRRGGYRDCERLALRTDFPYVCDHETWMLDLNNLNEEQKYYQKRGDYRITNWIRMV